MGSARRALVGFLAAAVSFLMVFGGLAASLAEGGMHAAVFPTSAPSATATSTLPAIPSGISPTPSFAGASSTPTTLPSPSHCPPPEGWVPVSVENGDTLDSLAEVYLSSPEALADANCLFGSDLFPGTVLYVPAPPPTETTTPAPTEPCGPPAGWVLYTVQPKDNLYRLSLAFGVSIDDLQLANCMGNSTFIRAGEKIYVPNVPTRTSVPSQAPTATDKPSATKTPTADPSPSATAPPATATPTPTLTATTATPTESSTATAPPAAQ